MVDELPPDLIAATSDLIRESRFRGTGANLVDKASNLLSLACATNDPELLRQAIKHISGEIRVTSEEGIQCDDSFHQHGPRQMIISYGRGFAANQAGFVELFAGTTFAFSDEKIRILSRLILDAQQWFIWGRQVDYHAMGRGAFRGGPGRHSWNARSYSRIADRMANADTARASEYAAFSERVTGQRPAGSSGPLGNKHFWRSDTMVHRTPDWYASVRSHSTRTYATETRTNRENLKGYHLADGTYFILQKGDEYHEVQPVWSYRKLPGLTYLDTSAPIPYGRDVPQVGNTAFVGGASDGLYGVSVMDYDKAGVKAKKAYFFIRDGLVCLGAGIESGKTDRVVTTLNQCRLRGDVTIQSEEGLTELEGESLAPSRIRAIHHNDIAYVVLDESTIGISAREQTGSWRDVEARASDAPVRQDIFTSWIDHGRKPADATYAYRIVPGVSREELETVSADSSVRILSNTVNVQAIHSSSEKVTEAVFHSPATLRLPDGHTLTTDRACTLIYRQTGDIWILTVSDPAQQLHQILVTLDRTFVGRGATITPAGTRIVVDLPTNGFAGQSVIIPLSPRG